MQHLIYKIISIFIIITMISVMPVYAATPGHPYNGSITRKNAISYPVYQYRPQSLQDGMEKINETNVSVSDCISALIKDKTIADADTKQIDAVCSKMLFLKMLYKWVGSPVTSVIQMATNVNEEYGQALLYGKKAGIISDESSDTLLKTPLTEIDAVRMLWTAAGKPDYAGGAQLYFYPDTYTSYHPAEKKGDPESDPYDQSNDTDDIRALRWAADLRIYYGDEEKNFDASAYVTVGRACQIFYYRTHLRNADMSFTKDQFVAECKYIMDFCRQNKYVYQTCKTWDEPIASHGFIACSTLPSRVLEDFGYTDIMKGGESSQHMMTTMDRHLDEWEKHVGTLAEVAPYMQAGSIVCVWKQNEETSGHTFVSASTFDLSTKSGDRFDSGSDDRIHMVQPWKNVKWYHRTDLVAVYDLKGE